MFPVEDEGLRDRVIDEILTIALKDNVKARRLRSDGTYVRGRIDAANGDSDGPPLRSQYKFMELAREKAQAGPQGPGGTYHVRTTPPARPGAAVTTQSSGNPSSPVTPT